MPDVKVYIRRENLDKWNDIENKSEWINTLLKNSDNTKEYGKTREPPAGPMVTALSETLPIKRACCLGKVPCKHWLWDELTQAYTNTLTGEVRETNESL